MIVTDERAVAQALERGRQVLALEAELHAALLAVDDRAVRAVTEAWVTAWDTAVSELRAAVEELTEELSSGVYSTSAVVRSQKAAAAFEALAESFERAARLTGAAATEELRAAVLASVGMEEAMIAAQLPLGQDGRLFIDVNRADPEQIAAILARTTEQITALSLPLAAETLALVRAELIRGTVLGVNPLDVARRIFAAAEDRVNLTIARAINIARTEMLDATRAAAAATDAANARVLQGWVWVAHLDPATCRSCVAMHGTEHPVEEPGPYDHHQGRCARVPKVRPWSELGFPGIEDQPLPLPDAEAWFAGLTPEQQRSILGVRGYEAWSAGAWPRSEWSVRRSSPGWRDAYFGADPPRRGR